jgi:hypothetical protein
MKIEHKLSLLVTYKGDMDKCCRNQTVLNPFLGTRILIWALEEVVMVHAPCACVHELPGCSTQTHLCTRERLRDTSQLFFPLRLHVWPWTRVQEPRSGYIFGCMWRKDANLILSVLWCVVARRPTPWKGIAWLAKIVQRICGCEAFSSKRREQEKRQELRSPSRQDSDSDSDSSLFNVSLFGSMKSS